VIAKLTDFRDVNVGTPTYMAPNVLNIKKKCRYLFFWRYVIRMCNVERPIPKERFIKLPNLNDGT
ncbi:Hypothetical protein EIN_225260, partial [Entamoeba invadens IP1]